MQWGQISKSSDWHTFRASTNVQEHQSAKEHHLVENSSLLCTFKVFGTHDTEKAVVCLSCHDVASERVIPNYTFFDTVLQTITNRPFIARPTFFGRSKRHTLKFCWLQGKR